MGIIVDNTRTRWEKFRPWLAIGTIINAVIFVCFFTDWGLSGTALYVFAAVMYNREREKISVIPRIFASIGGSLIVAGFGLQIMDFIGKGDAQKGYTGFAWIIAIAFVVLTGITVCNVKSADGTYYCKE